MTERITDEQRAALVVDLRTKRVAGGGNMIPHMVMDEAADLIEAQAAELATLRAERDGSAGVRIQDIAQYLLDHLPSYADHPAWDAMQDAVDDGLDEDDCIRAWLRALAKIGGAA